MYFQHAPAQLTVGSRYRTIQKEHDFAATGGLIPDLVLRFSGAGGVRWVLVKVMGVERRVEESARAAARDLLAYRRALESVLGQQIGPYGIGVAWGTELEPAASEEVVLCSPDRIEAAVELASGHS